MLSGSTRIIGTYSQGKKGPLLIVIAGMHGNEPAGVLAVDKVFSGLTQYQPDFNGKIIGIRGNIPALQVQRRFVETDLNRMWEPEHVQATLQTPSTQPLGVEQQEMKDIASVILEEIKKGYTECVLLDLHTTSAPGGLFSVINARSRNQELASALHSPVIFGLTHTISGTILSFAESLELSALSFESGQHHDLNSIDNHEAAVWIILSRLNCLHPDHIHNFDQYHERLIKASYHLPHFVEVIYRHNILPEDHFHMYPGFTNFREIYKGEPLGRDRNGAVICPHRGQMLMPLYQSQGAEGFFIVKIIEEPPAYIV